VESGLWPLLEYEKGELVGVKKIRRPRPVEEYLKLQGRYKHLFKKAECADMLSQIKDMALTNMAKYNLVD